jgi:hypothetical protein
LSLARFPEFRDISISNKEDLDVIFAKYPPEISEYTFTNLFVWRRAREIRLSRMDGLLVVLVCLPSGEEYFMPPVAGERVASEVRDLLRYLKRKGKEPKMGRIPESMVTELQRSGFIAVHDRDNSDYVYHRRDLEYLEGRKYDGKRNRIKKCLREHRCEYITVTSEVLGKCLEMQKAWCDVHQCALVPDLASEYEAIVETFGNFEDLKVVAGGVAVDGKLEAFAVGEKLNANTAVVHFEKANPGIEGLYQVVNQWFCKYALSGFEFVNREQDAGDEGLRKAKESYHPHHMVNKYVVRSDG